MKVKKKVSMNETIYVLDSVLPTLYERYKFHLPENIRDKFKSLCESVREEYVKDYMDDNYDIESVDLYEDVVFETFEDKFPTSDIISYYDLLTMYKDKVDLPKVIELEISKQHIRYIIDLDSVDNSFRGYLIENNKEVNEDKGVYAYLSECLLEGDCLRKCIKIIE